MRETQTRAQFYLDAFFILRTPIKRYIAFLACHELQLILFQRPTEISSKENRKTTLFEQTKDLFYLSFKKKVFARL